VSRKRARFFRPVTAAALLLLSAAFCAVPAQKSNAGVATPHDEKKANSTASRDGGGGTHFFYEFTQPEFYVRHILIEHDATGHGRILFERKDEEEALTDPLEISPAALSRILPLWEALRFLDSTTDYQSPKQFPHLGTMRLRMTRGGRERTAEFNWTNDRDVFALVNEYRRIADQALFVLEIDIARQNQPLDAPRLMDELDTLFSRGGLSDPKQLSPLLQDLSTDERIPLMARNHAERLLKKINKSK